MSEVQVIRFKTEQGVNFKTTITYVNTHGVAPADYAPTLTIKRYAGDDSTVLSITDTETANGSKITLSGTASSIIISVVINGRDMASLDEKQFQYDIRLVDTSDNTRLPAAGEIDNRVQV